MFVISEDTKTWIAMYRSPFNGEITLLEFDTEVEVKKEMENFVLGWMLVTPNKRLLRPEEISKMCLVVKPIDEMGTYRRIDPNLYVFTE